MTSISISAHFVIKYHSVVWLHPSQVDDRTNGSKCCAVCLLYAMLLIYFYTIFLSFLLSPRCSPPSCSLSLSVPSPSNRKQNMKLKQNLIKTTNSKMKPEEKKKAHKNMGSVCAGQLLLGRGPPWKEINVPSITPLEKINFPIPGRYQLWV